MPVATAAVSPTAVSQQIKQLGDDSTAGTMVSPLLDSSGNPAKVTIFGPNSTQGGVATATGVQLSGNQNTAVVRGQGAGIVATFASTLTPASVVTLTALDQTLTTVWGTNPVINALTTDMLVVNKPTSQAGLGFGNPRVTTTGALGTHGSDLGAAAEVSLHAADGAAFDAFTQRPGSFRRTRRGIRRTGPSA